MIMKFKIFLLVLGFVAAALPVLAFETYDNTRLGYSGGVPAGFDSFGEDTTGSGITFAKGQIVLSYWGEALREPSFAKALAASRGYAERDGWNIDFEVSTNHWGAFTGIMGKQRFYRRMILLCGGKDIASMTLQYSTLEAAKMRDLIAVLEAQFTQGDC